MESQLLSLQLEQKKLQAELDKVPESGHRTMVQRRLREELERDLKLIEVFITKFTCKVQLKSFGEVFVIRQKLTNLDFVS